MFPVRHLGFIATRLFPIFTGPFPHGFAARAMSTSATEEHDFFRCPVSRDMSGAIIRSGRRRLSAGVQETSIDGFTVLVSPKVASKLRVGRTWVLEYQDAIIEVHPQWFFNAPDGHVQIGLRRLRDLTPPEPIRKSLLVRYGGTRYGAPNVSAAMYGGFVLLLFLLFAMPGLGDRLGTSKRIQGAFQSIVLSIDAAIRSF